MKFVVSDSSSGWPHPWQITPRWDIKEKEWVFSVKPGFVNGVEVTALTRVKHATSRTIERLKKAGEKKLTDEKLIDAFLCESPGIQIGTTRTIGTGASATGISGGFSLTYEPVPAFFTNLGVTAAHTQTKGNINSGITFTDQKEDNSKKARRLRACDVSLWKDRPSAKFDVYEGSILDGSMGAINIVYSNLGGMKKNPYLRINSKFNPPPVPDSAMALLEGMTDQEYDVIKVATIYFLSREGAVAGAELDSTWEPFVEYNIFWNLAHSPQRIPNSTPIEPIRLITPLLAGIANLPIAMILSPYNDLLNRAIQTLKSRNLAGRFWSL